MTTEAPHPFWLRRTIAAAIKSFLLSAVALVCVYFVSPEATKASLEKIRSFTPAMMFSLIEDAMGECDPDNSDVEASSPNLADFRYPHALNLTKSDLLRAPPCRARPFKGDTKGDTEEWPTVGHWLAWLDKQAIPRFPIISAMIAMTDVGVHLAFAPSVPMKFLGLMQLLFGFGITAAIVRRLDARLNDYWAALLLFFGTLMIGSAIAWVLLPLIGVILGGIEGVIHSPVVKFILAIAISLSGTDLTIHQLLEWSAEKARDKTVKSLADKAAELFLRYI